MKPREPKLKNILQQLKTGRQLLWTQNQMEGGNEKKMKNVTEDLGEISSTVWLEYMCGLAEFYCDPYKTKEC